MLHVEECTLNLINSLKKYTNMDGIFHDEFANVYKFDTASFWTYFLDIGTEKYFAQLVLLLIKIHLGNSKIERVFSTTKRNFFG